MTSQQAGDRQAEHPLDRVVWLSLSSGHRHWAEGDERVKRYPTDVAPFHALSDDSEASFEALARISSPQHIIALVTLDALAVPAQFEVIERKTLNQMLGPNSVSAVDSSDIELLQPGDQPAMLELVKITQPGPFFARTNQIGKYFAVRGDKRLLAMTGERMRPAGFSEVSAVCVHPDGRGRGYAGRLLQHVANIAIERGETPFLHVLHDNHGAIALYQKYGFTLRRSMPLTLIRKRA